ncbi:MAG TPA: hypothetical protein VLG37_00840 [Candidatus Saccharimonadales bacterium]|nr:hypothetical protein [Candidatus Saccharimonadales bacterium]
MKVVVLYRPNSEHGTAVEAFIRDFRARHDSSKLEILNVDSREGTALASLYDIMQYPAILALRDDGSLSKSWEGETLPLMDELAYYVFDVT